MRIVVTEFVSLDRVYQGPGSPTEDTSGGFALGGWLVPYLDDRFVRQALDWLADADGLLLGRRTYQAFARDWPRILCEEPDDPFAERMNALPKYLVSNTVTDPGWGPVTVLAGDPINRLRELKRHPGGELQIHGSGRLANSLLAAGMVDTLRLVVAPVTLRSGRRLLTGDGPAGRFRLRQHEATSTGLLLLGYDFQGTAETGEYAGVTDLG